MKLVALAVMAVAGVALAGEPSAAPPKKAKAPAAKASTSSKKSKPKTGTGSAALEFGTLEFEIKGSFTVSLDGKELGQTPLKPVKVLAGKHQLRLVNAELKIDHTEDVEVKPRQRSTFQISLE